MSRKSTWFYRLFYSVAGPILRRTHHVSLDNPLNIDFTDTNGEGCLLISNHVGFYDPFYISAVAGGKTVRWVTGAYLFKLRLLKSLLTKHMGCIPKQQGLSDFTCMRTMQRALKDGDLVGIFPEGTRSWDGEMVDIDYRSLAKMIRMFRVKVVFIHLEGGFAQQPRWADNVRKGKVTVKIASCLTVQDIQDMDLAQLEDTVRQSMRFSNDEWKTQVDYVYRSKDRAKGIQRLFYMCPSCKKIGTIRTRKNLIYCSKCNASAILNEMDWLQGLCENPIDFTTLNEYHSWEKNQLSDCKGFDEEKGVLFQSGDFDNNGKLTTLAEDITVSCRDNTIIVRCNGDGKEYRLPFERTTSFILNAKQTMELYCDDKIYRIRLLPDSSSLKYLELYQMQQKLQG